MKRVMYLLSLAMFVCPGCATIISGNQQEVAITSIPRGATVTCDNGNIINTPGSVVLSTKKAHTLVASYPGCEPQQISLVKKMNNWIFADIIWDFGIITIPIDLISGAACELKPKSVHFSFAATAIQPARNSFPGKLQPQAMYRMKTDEKGEPIKDEKGIFIFEEIEN